AHEQVGRVRPLRLARGAADLGGARVPRALRRGGVPSGDERAARPAAPARAGGALDPPRVGGDRFGLHLHQRRGRVRRQARAGARRAGADGADLARDAREGDPHGHRRGAPACRHRSAAAAVRNSRPDPVAAPRRALPQAARRARPGAPRLRPHAGPSPRCSARAQARRAPLTDLFDSQGVRPMPHYTPPLRDMQFVLHELIQVVDQLKVLPRHADVDAATIDAVIEEGGKFAAEVLAPLNQSGDEQGCVLDKATHEVKAPTGFKEAYAKFVAGGWPALSADPQYGGQGLPIVLNQCLYEMLNSANQAWTMYPGLSHGAYECLHAHGTDEQRALYLPKLTSGQWTGTMCLTEAHCGTDLGLLRTKA